MTDTGSTARPARSRRPWRAALRARIAEALADRRGVAAIEFAFLAPVLLCMYFVTMEVAQAIETSKKVSRVGSMVADLVTQQPEISKTELEAVMKIGEALLQPYRRSRPTITVSGIRITNDTPSKVLVEWSAQLQEGSFRLNPYAKMSATTVPASLKISGTFLVRVESALTYLPVLVWSADKKAIGLAAAFDDLSMGETFHLRSRQSEDVTCKDC